MTGHANEHVAEAQDRHRGTLASHPVANAGIGMLGAGLGAAAAAGVAPIVVPALVVGGLAGYFLTNKIPAE